MYCHDQSESSYPRRRPTVKGHLAGLLIGAALVLLFGAAVLLLWNAVLPGLLHVSRISFGQSVGLLLLSRILVGGFHPRHGFRRHAARDSRRQYEEWWRQVGEQSFQQFAARPSSKEEQK